MDHMAFSTEKRHLNRDGVQLSKYWGCSLKANDSKRQTPQSTGILQVDYPQLLLVLGSFQSPEAAAEWALLVITLLSGVKSFHYIKLSCSLGGDDRYRVTQQGSVPRWEMLKYCTRSLKLSYLEGNYLTGPEQGWHTQYRLLGRDSKEQLVWNTAPKCRSKWSRLSDHG